MEVTDSNIQKASGMPLIIKTDELVIDCAIYGNPCGAYSETKEEGSKFWTELLSHLGDEVQKLYDFLDGQELELPIDLYLLGDTVNLLKAIKVQITNTEK